MENGWREGAQSCGLGADLSGAAGTADVAGMGLGGAAGAGLGGGFRILSDTTRMTFPSDNPAVRIDYILGRGLPESAVVTERQVDTSTVASDHCPLWVSLAWRK